MIIKSYSLGRCLLLVCYVRPVLELIFDTLKNTGINISFKSNIHQKFAIVDQRIVWYGSVNLLSFGSAKESIMRLESPNVANELMKSIESFSSMHES